MKYDISMSREYYLQLGYERDELQERIDKAIEYITKYWISFEDIEEYMKQINEYRDELQIPIEEVKKLLDILKGSDNDD